MSIKTVDEFIKEIATQYPPFTNIDNDFKELKRTKFNKNECLFVWDARQGSILFVKGFKNLLGFEDDKITLNDFTNLFHKTDKDLVLKIGQTAVKYSLECPESNLSHNLYISHRIKTANGDFIKILAQSKPYEIDEKGYITKFLVIFSNISFVDTTNVVQYKFMAKGLDTKNFHNRIFEHKNDIFTHREVEIIQGIEKGRTNNEIGTLLDISKHTVATHRKKIMKKSDCHSVAELLLFCKKNGILIN